MHKHDTWPVPCFEMMHQVAEIVLYRSIRSLTLLCAGKVGVDMESTPSRKIVSGCRIGTINVCKFGRCFETADLICLFRASPILYSQTGVSGSWQRTGWGWAGCSIHIFFFMFFSDINVAWLVIHSQKFGHLPLEPCKFRTCSCTLSSNMHNRFIFSNRNLCRCSIQILWRTNWIWVVHVHERCAATYAKQNCHHDHLLSIFITRWFVGSFLDVKVIQPRWCWLAHSWPRWCSPTLGSSGCVLPFCWGACQWWGIRGWCCTWRWLGI